MLTIRKKLSELANKKGESNIERIKNDREALRKAAQDDPDCPPLTEEEAAELRPSNAESDEEQ